MTPKDPTGSSDPEEPRKAPRHGSDRSQEPYSPADISEQFRRPLPNAAPPLDRIGPYRILESLGEGGMGEVFLAEQQEPIRRRVALKVIKLGMDTKEVIGRFESERQALALMNHPNVAKVFDAGATEQGRPYFVMEHVPGVSINDYCDLHNLSTRERLELLIPVCLAIHHAHQKGIIHRDVKPSNVLVAVQDGKPVPKVIDFGVAKAIDHRLTQKTVLTEQGRLIGTPAYMSPEQAEMTGLNIDTTTDVYSLGVLLYELLVGVLPFDPHELLDVGPEGIHRVIREVDPPTPSSRISTLGASAREVALHRHALPDVLVRQVRGELDWITMRAMEKDRTRRYPSASELAADIERYLRNEPVIASPPSAAYRLSKLVRRRRGVFASLAAVFLALMAGVVVSTTMYFRAERAREEAQARAEELDLVTEFQASMLSGIDVEEMGRAMVDDLRDRVQDSLEGEGISSEKVESALAVLDRTLRRANATDMALELVDEQVLNRAVEAIGEKFADQPLVRAALQQTVADTYTEFGRYPRALTLQEAALDTRRHMLGDDHPETLNSINYMGVLLYSMGKLDEALVYWREALEGRRKVLGDDHPKTLISIGNMGSLLWSMGKFDEALSYFQEDLEVSRRVLGNDDPNTLTSINNMGVLLHEMGKFDEALVYCREALEARRRVLGDDHTSTLTSIGNKGSLLADMGKLDEALVYHRKDLEGNRRVLGDDHPNTLISINNLGLLLAEMGGRDEALVYYREALEGFRRVLGDDHPETLISIGNVGGVLWSMGKLDEALVYCREALEGKRKVLGDDHPETLGSIYKLGGLFLDQGKAQEAMALLTPAEAAARLAFTGGNVRRLGLFLTPLGRSRAATGAFDAALSDLTEAYAILREAPSATTESRKKALTGLVNLYEAWHSAEPGAGYDTKAAEWRAKLEDEGASTGARWSQKNL
ncbi:tetratricopeptide repeat protein [Candidatus Eisenbacteria bacterium]|uniref:Tetratricopeptide repeat protein n=1 Tax=Eiseniibacteriota bacterium TaxID=2212470 RepID=A0ABV6YM23_UNCEI